MSPDLFFIVWWNMTRLNSWMCCSWIAKYIQLCWKRLEHIDGFPTINKLFPLLLSLLMRAVAFWATSFNIFIKFQIWKRNCFVWFWIGESTSLWCLLVNFLISVETFHVWSFLISFLLSIWNSYCWSSLISESCSKQRVKFSDMFHDEQEWN